MKGHPSSPTWIRRAISFSKASSVYSICTTVTGECCKTRTQCPGTTPNACRWVRRSGESPGRNPLTHKHLPGCASASVSQFAQFGQAHPLFLGARFTRRNRRPKCLIPLRSFDAFAREHLLYSQNQDVTNVRLPEPGWNARGLYCCNRNSDNKPDGNSYATGRIGRRYVHRGRKRAHTSDRLSRLCSCVPSYQK